MEACPLSYNQVKLKPLALHCEETFYYILIPFQVANHLNNKRIDFHKMLQKKMILFYCIILYHFITINYLHKKTRIRVQRYILSVNKTRICLNIFSMEQSIGKIWDKEYHRIVSIDGALCTSTGINDVVTTTISFYGMEANGLYMEY